jgi:hypothetical protein
MWPKHRDNGNRGVLFVPSGDTGGRAACAGRPDSGRRIMAWMMRDVPAQSGDRTAGRRWPRRGQRTARAAARTGNRAAAAGPGVLPHSLPPSFPLSLSLSLPLSRLDGITVWSRPRHGRGTALANGAALCSHGDRRHIRRPVRVRTHRADCARRARERAHGHGLAPGCGGVVVGAANRRRVTQWAKAGLQAFAQ